MITNHRGKLSLLLLFLGIASFFLLPDLVAVFVGPLLFIMALALWTLPLPTASNGEPVALRPDPRTRNIANIMLGTGLGLLAAIIFFFVPEDVAYYLMGTGLLLMIGYLVWIMRR